jgi:lipoyl(octanoyl) transferase
VLKQDFEVRTFPGLTRFADAYQLQKDCLELRIRDEIPDTLLFFEHAPVITRGRGLQFQPGRTEREKPLPQIPAGIDYVEIERGGDLTWHGPGQLVCYPIVKLGGSGTVMSIGKHVGPDINEWIRFQESVWMKALKLSGIETFTKAGGSGVWAQLQGRERKLVSVGIALRKWVSYHGTAANIVNDPSAFIGFDPCGFEASVMARVADFVPSHDPSVQREEWRQIWEQRWIRSLLET